MVDRDGGSGPRTELDLAAQAAAAVEAAREGASAPETPAPQAPEIVPAPPARGTRDDLPAPKPLIEARVVESRTELDLTAAAKMAVELARRQREAAAAGAPIATPPPPPVEPEHKTQLAGAPGAMGTPAPQKPRASAYAPTAFHAAMTSATPPGAESAPAEPELEELPEGTLLAGRYHILHMVGHGGMGAVYAAHDDDLDEDIALKILRTDLARDAEFKRRLKAEVRLARRVSHPNVCRVHDFGIDDETVFVTMELVRGRTLRERIAELRVGRAEPFELAQIVDIVVQIGSALSAAHRAGVIHRDVKPDNVILSEGRAVLTDFGVASMAIDGGPKHIVGTPAYLAPEVLRGEPADHRVDVYAVACMAFELIAGETPFGARTVEIAMQVARERRAVPPLPDPFGTPALRGMLDRVLSRGLASDPEARAPTIDRFVDAFAHAARSAPLSTGLRGRFGSEQLTPVDTTTPIPIARRNELRVTTALVWYANRGARDTEEAEKLVVDFGGVPIRVAPGEIVALYGAMRSTGDDADRAGYAALALVEKFGGRAGLDTTRILLRPGDTGLAGPDSASTAASLAHEARNGEVWASPGTARQLAARFDITSAPGEARRITSVARSGRARKKSAPPPNKRKAASEIGREVGIAELRAVELAELDAHVERACQERRPVFVEVRGMPGAGKTKLRKALVSSVRARREVDWLIASLSPVGEAAPLQIVSLASTDWYEATTKDAADPAIRFRNATRWLEARATRRPIALVVEDVQWSDPTSKNLLDHLRASLTAVPVVIIAFARGDSAKDVPDGVNLVLLGPLDDARAAKLARSIAPTATPEAIARIIARAAGNPFFIEELARDITATGSTLPTTIEAVVQAHLDQLPDAAQQIAIAGSVIGAGFWRRAVARLVQGVGDAVLDAALADLERNAVIARASSTTINDDYYQFASTLVRDVAYSRLPAKERRQLHAGVAGWLDEQARNSDKDAARLLAVAHHREQAGDHARAAVAYRQAGKQCLDQYAYGEAAAALRKAAALVAVPDPTLDEELGDALVNTEGYPAAEPIYQRAFDECDDDDNITRARLLYKLGVGASKRGNTKHAIARFEAGLAIAAPGGKLAAWGTADPRIPAQLWSGLGWTLGYQLGQVDEGHPYCERAVAALEGTPHRRDLAQALSRLGGTYMRGCRFADQLKTNQRNLEIAVELGDLNMQLTAHINLGVVHGVLGDVQEAVHATLAARKLAARMGAAASDGLAASNLAGYYIEQRKLDEANALLDEAIATLERTGSRYVLAESFVFRARIAAARGQLADARQFAEKSQAIARSLGNQLDAAIALRILAQLDGRAGDHDGARQKIEEALVQATMHDEYEAIRTRAARARLLKLAGDATADGELSDVEYDLTRLGTKRELAALRDLTEVR